MEKIEERFIRYAKIDTQSDPENEQCPSTEKQWKLAKLLVKELEQIGLEEVTIDDHAYVMATLPANTDQPVPVIGFIAHMDTAPDFTAENVQPQIHKNYDGGDIILNQEQNIVLSPKDFKELPGYKGQTLITTDGTTLLGADDKAGIAEIIAAMEYLLEHPEIKHGKIRVAFNPDEEVGRGAHLFDVEKFGADWAYTLDGGPVGELEFENFNAAGAKVIISGKSVHPGTAYHTMVNSMLIAAEFIASFPEKETPQETRGYEGFFHLYQMEGRVEETVLQYIIRDHDRKLFEEKKKRFMEKAEAINKKYGNVIKVEMEDQYYNMREKIEPQMHIIDIAEEAMKSLNIQPIVKAIRGGTDGAQLSFKGLPCPNLFTGGHNFHGRYEYIPVESMEKAISVIVKIIELTAQKGIR
ncbi:peptidase T [Candidatus Sulfidibacterium hydrothermale]|uniref:peptidase T n=1 Tax=Candidatus Sulfidibacterium hydrothermale TaxID=2875962 RepID=UPI001F0B2FE7|nr:peptidase T [Candidatus Sulfidibacterium hydrothermale]UBM61733.1 peptidase T [Candidatus Sulfidibacterium hydrothermale]